MTPILLLVALAIVQLVLMLTARSTLATAAVEGARAAALAGSSAAAGISRVHELLDGAVPESSVVGVEIRSTTVDGRPAVGARIDYRPALLGLLLPTELTVEGHVLVEGAP